MRKRRKTSVYFCGGRPWVFMRAKEANGFVSKRITMAITNYDSVCYGTAVVQSYAKGVRVIRPWEVAIEKGKGF